MFPHRRKPPTPTAVSAVPLALLAPRYTRIRSVTPAVLIPGESVLETTTVGGTITFFSIYQNVIIARILMSWFPGIQGSPLLRPLITVCDPYLSLFRKAVPPIFGLDLSPLLALFFLQALGSVCLPFLSHLCPFRFADELLSYPILQNVLRLPPRLEQKKTALLRCAALLVTAFLCRGVVDNPSA